MKKLQFDFSDDAVKRLDKLVEDVNSNRAAVIRNALRSYEYLIKQKKEGFELNFIKK